MLPVRAPDGRGVTPAGTGDENRMAFQGEAREMTGPLDYGGAKRLARDYVCGE